MVLDLSNNWSLKGPPWFRGQLESEKNITNRLLPKVFHPDYLGRENELIQVFRMRAQRYGPTPEFSRIDQWLFLMQHSGLPTRLLDWSEGALIALYFAINRFKQSEETPVVWLLNPLALNLISMGVPGFSLTWLGYKHNTPVPIPHICAAFSNGNVQTSPYPIAIYPQPVHPRVTAQRGTFTIHGNTPQSLENILNSIDDNTVETVITGGLNALTSKGQSNFGKIDPQKIVKEFLDGNYLFRIIIECKDREVFLRDLRSLGVSQSTLFPEMDGLAEELKHLKTEIY